MPILTTAPTREPSLPRRPDSRRLLALAVAVAVLAAGCGAAVPDAAPATSTTAAVAQETPTATRPPTPTPTPAPPTPTPTSTSTPASQPPAAPAVLVTTGEVTAVVDGDTIDVNGQRVRVIGIDTPEVGQCGYAEAARAMTTLVGGRTVTLTSVDTKDNRDRYDRLLRYVDVNGTDAGLALIQQGLAIARYDSRTATATTPANPPMSPPTPPPRT